MSAVPWNGSSSFVLSPVTAASNVLQIQPSGDSSGATDVSRLNSALSQAGPGSAILLAPGQFFWPAGQAVINQNAAVNGIVSLLGSGDEVTRVFGVGTGDVLRVFNSNLIGGNPYLPGGGQLKGITFDGTHLTGTGNSLVHLGDLFKYDFDFSVDNLAPGAGIGAWLDNQYLQMEQGRGYIKVHKCGNPAVQFDNSTGTSLSAQANGSFDRTTVDIKLDQKGNGNCVVFANGAFMQDTMGGGLTITGNTDYGSATYYVLTLTGSNAAGFSRLAKCSLNVGVECNNTGTGTPPTQPATINFNSQGNNTILDCTGVIDFSGNNPFAGARNAPLSFTFDGPVYGDGFLQSSGPLYGAAFKFSGSGAAGVLANGDAITTRFPSVIEVTTSANVTGIILQSFPPDEWRTMYLMNNGTGTITMAASATSHVANGTSCVVQPNSTTAFVLNPDFSPPLWFQVVA